MTRFLAVLQFCLLVLPIHAFANLPDTIEVKLTELNSDEAKMQYCSDEVWYYAFSQPTLAEKIALRELELAEKVGSDYWLGDAYNSLSIAQIYQGNYQVALNTVRKSLNYRLILNDSMALASSYGKLAIIHQELANLDSSIHYLLQSLEIFKAFNQFDNVVNLYCNLSNISRLMQEYNQALDYCIEAEQIVPTDSLTLRTQAQLIGTKALALGKLNQQEESKNELLKAKEIYLQLNYQHELAIVENNIGIVFKILHQFDSAIVYFNRAIELAVVLNDSAGIGEYTMNLGNAYAENNQPQKALPFLNQAEELGKNQNDFNLLERVYAGKVLAYKQLNDFESALHFQTLQSSVKDSILNTEKLQVIKDLEIKYESAQKEQQIELLEATNALKDNEIQQKQILAFAAVLLALFLVLVAFIMFRNKQLKQQKQFAEAIIQEKEKGIKAVILSTENEQKRIAKDLHDGIGQQLSGLKLALSHYFNSTHNQMNETTTELLTVVDDACTEVRAISHQMMPKSLQENGLEPAITDLVNKSLKLSNIQCELDFFQVNRYNELIEITVYRVLQELINNTIKHANANEVTIQFLNKNSELMVLYTDNGIGIKSNSSDGIGMLNIQSRLQQIAGKIHIDSANSGTFIRINIPLQSA